MEIPYEIGQRVWQVTKSNNKPELIEHEITMITIKKDKSIKLRLTRVNEKWSHEISSDKVNTRDTANTYYYSNEVSAVSHYEVLKTYGDTSSLWKQLER
jgi:hypothetical protein